MKLQKIPAGARAFRKGAGNIEKTKAMYTNSWGKPKSILITYTIATTLKRHTI